MSNVTPIGIQRIERRLEAFIPFLDMDDYKTRPQQVRQASLSRALAAYIVHVLGGADPLTAAKSVTDRFHDRGIDAIYHSQGTSQLLLVQTKWASGIDWKDAGEFADGVRNLVIADWPKFASNEKIYKRRNEIEIALQSAAKVVLVTVHHGSNPAEGCNLKRVDDLAAEIDDGSGLAQAVHWHQPHLLGAIQQESEPPKVSAAIYLANWAEIKDPYYAVYGRVQAQAIAELWRKHPHLTHMNLREYARRSDVNLAIAKTARGEPQHFWYFNNGLTIICDSISPAIYGRLQPDVALFNLEGISLVNGAQTTGIVADNFSLIPDAEKSKLWIQLRAIAVRNCPDGFAKRVTQFTNLQNAITVQDFVGLDPIHSRIATDFAIEKRKYAFRWGGDGDPIGEQGCTLREATIALACANPDPWFAVQAKREISLLWDTGSNRYKALFHPELPAMEIWHAVKIMREVDNIVAACGNDLKPRADFVANHLQRLVLHIVFQDPALAGWKTTKDISAILATAISITPPIFERVRGDVVKHHVNEYIASLAKNFDKCVAIVRRLLDPEPPPTAKGDGYLPFVYEDPRKQ